jgi:hypothetical protein
MARRTKALTPLGVRWAAAAGREMGRWKTWAALHAAKRELALLVAPPAQLPQPSVLAAREGTLAVASELADAMAQLEALRAAEALVAESQRKAAELAAMRAELSQQLAGLTHWQRAELEGRTPGSPGTAARQAALAEARAELAELLTPSKRRPSPAAARTTKQRESLSNLRAELAYLESLSRKPTVVTPHAGCRCV